MKLNLIITGDSYADIMEKCHAECVRFYGELPYRIVKSAYDGSQGRYDNASGAILGFQFSMVAELIP
ncbi:hypothetical protein AB0B57_22445 [Micromonospora sp. NPDC049101]|uniref:hypothetical protein n=1 Tax=Micromonospora sp. NPDC049101 TaxID=3155032 RepID=UPI0033C2BDB5